MIWIFCVVVASLTNIMVINGFPQTHIGLSIMMVIRLWGWHHPGSLSGHTMDIVTRSGTSLGSFPLPLAVYMKLFLLFTGWR